MKEIIEKIFEYDNYRAFLKDYFSLMKKKKAFFTLKYFAKKAGFNSASFCMYVIDGRRNLSYKSIPKMIKGLELRGKRATYFENLVLMNQATSIEERERHYSTIEKLRKSTKYYKINKKQFAYFEEWYYPVIRELVAFSDWNEDYAKLAKMVRPEITPEKAKNAVKLLLEIGLIKRDENGKYKQLDSALTAEGLPSFIFKKVRKELIIKAIEAAENISPKERHISGSTVALSRNNYEKVCELLADFHKELAIMANEDENNATNRVYQINLQAFPLSSKERDT